MLEMSLDWQKVFAKNSTGYIAQYVVAMVSGRTEGRKQFLVCDIADDHLSIAQFFQGTTDKEEIKTRFVWIEPPVKIYKKQIEDEIIRLWGTLIVNKKDDTDLIENDIGAPESQDGGLDGA